METCQFVPSRLSNLRDRKQSHQQQLENDSSALKLILQDDDKSYEPTFSNTRTSMRLFKGKLQGKVSSDKHGLGSANTIESLSSQSKHSLFDSKQEMKLVLHDSPQFSQKKIIQEVPNRQAPKRIMITRPSQKQVPQISVNKEPENIEQPKRHQVKQETMKQEYFNPHDEKPIITQEAEESKDVQISQNDLVLCPEGCGRKFNRKALQKHVKACKIVFMSKRKQFNSQAKRFTSKQQAAIVKQTKKNATNLKGKGFEKTSENWKNASQDFRSALKAIKREDQNQNEEKVIKNGEENKQNEGAFNLIGCQFCEKMFAKILIQKHMDNCLKKKELQKKKKNVTKKK